MTPKKKVMKGPKKTLNRYGMEVEEVMKPNKNVENTYYWTKKNGE